MDYRVSPAPTARVSLAGRGGPVMTKIRIYLSGMPSRKILFAASDGWPLRSFRQMPASRTGGVRRPLIARTISRIAGTSGRGKTGMSSAAPKRPLSDRQNRFHRFRPVNQNEFSVSQKQTLGGTRSTNRVSASDAICARRRARSGEIFFRDGSLNGGLIKTRSALIAAGSCGPPLCASLNASAATISLQASKPFRFAFSTASAARSRVDLDKGHALNGFARKQRKPRRADTGAEIDRVFRGRRSRRE